MADQARGGETAPINDLVEEYRRNGVDRRTFVQRAGALGLSATAISALLGVGPAGAQGLPTPPGGDPGTEGDDVTTTGNATGDTAGTSILAQLSDDLANAVERAGAGVVTVNARRRMPASGILWDAAGHIVTANHVVERDEEITVGLPDGRELPAALVGRDAGSDIALLKVDAPGLEPAPRATNPARIGHLVLAVGRPGASGAMASFGTVSVVGGAWRTSQGANVAGFVRADVAMLPGFSGGPLVDASGAVIGINSSTLGRGGGMTIPASAIDTVVAALAAHGKVRRGFLGIGAQAVRLPAALRDGLGLNRETGLLLVAVEPDGPAERDGLLIGDIVVALNDEPVAEVEELQEQLTGDWVGRPIPVKVVRGGQLHDVAVTVGERS